MRTKSPKTVAQKYAAIQAIGPATEVPFEVWRIFGDKQKTVEIMGDQVFLGEDYVGFETARSAIAWYVKQFGGKVTWD